MYSHSTLYHLINDSLMPEQKRFEDPHLFRRLWRHLQPQLLKVEAIFINPIEAFAKNELFLDKEIKKEWLLWEQIPLHSTELPDLKRLNYFYPQSTKTRFFVLLFWQSMHMAFLQLAQDLAQKLPPIQKKYFLMHFMSQLEQYLDDNANKRKSPKEIRSVFHALLSFYWLKAYRDFYALLSLESLRYFEEELLSPFRDAAEDSFVFDIGKSLLPAKEKKEDLLQLPLVDLAKHIQTDIKEMQSTVEQFKADPYSLSNHKIYLQPKEAAELLHICTQTLSNWRRKGLFTDYRKTGNRYEYSLEEIKKINQQPTHKTKN